MHFTRIPTDHKDLIYDVAYDHHGKRMATSSCDQYVKIWDLIGDEWKCTASVKAHSGVVWKVIWASPEYGQVIATCSNDRTVAVWEELTSEDNSNNEGRQWMRKGNLVDSKSPMVDIKFAPKHLGLKLAMVSLDGNVCIYEAPDVMNLCQWSKQNEFSCKISTTCLDWSPSKLHPPLLVIGSDDVNQPYNILIYEYSDQSRMWIKLDGIKVPCGGVKDLSFSANLGRSYDLLAVAGTQALCIITLSKNNEISHDWKQVTSPSKYKIQVLANINDHHSQVWRLNWNVLGTVLASAGDDGCIKLWKGNYMNEWSCICTIKPSTDQGITMIPNKSKNTDNLN